MAELRYIRPNRLREEANRYHRQLLWIGTPLLVGAAFIHVLVLWAGLIILYLLWEKPNTHLSGAEGEDRALGIPDARPGSLATLHKDYIVFNQLQIPAGRSCRELDYVVVGPNGIFAVEVKHYRGEISGAEFDRTWRQRKRSRAGHLYEQERRNPVAQIKGGVYALRRRLAAHGIRNWIEGMVVFTHPEGVVKADQGSIPVLTLPELASYITAFRPRWAPRKLDVTVRVLMELAKAETAPTAKPSLYELFASGNTVRRKPRSPQHISCFMQDFLKPAEKIREIMNHDASKAIMEKRCSNPVVMAEPLPVTPPRLIEHGTPRKAVPLTVIPGGRQGKTPTVTKIREVTVTMQRTEIESVPEKKNDESF